MFNIVRPDYDHQAARDFFKNSLHESINYLIDFYDLNEENKSPELCWQMCAAHYLAAKCAQTDDHQGAVKYLRYLASLPAANDMVVSPLTSDEQSFDKEMILRIICDDKELGFGYCDDASLARTEAEKIYQALDVIRENVPDAWNEIRAYIHAIQLTSEKEGDSRFMRSGTNFYMWGMMFAYINKEHTVPYYIDILAHECGHTALNILNAYDELVLNDVKETFAAPLRPDDRPMIGIFHAFFVLSRICYVLQKIVDNGTSQYVQECRERFSVAFTKLRNTQQIVHKNAKFTVIGQTIYDGICRLWNLT